jgi:Domain of unknown function (DUF4303)
MAKGKGRMAKEKARADENPFLEFVGVLGTFPGGVDEINAWVGELRDDEVKPSEIDYDYIKSELAKAINCFFKKLSPEVDLRKVYAFGLYISEELNYVSPTANIFSDGSEEISRWSPPDWKYHLFSQDCFHLVEKEILKGWDEDFSQFKIDSAKLIDIYLEVLTNTREMYFSNTDTVVGIFMGGMGDRLVTSSIKHINPVSVSQKFMDSFLKFVDSFLSP